MRSWTIGRDPECDLVVDHDQISNNHCRLEQGPSGYVLEDLQSTNGTFVNGNRISTRASVETGDKIMLAGSVPMPWPNEAHPATLIADAQKREITIGRDPDGDCVLDDCTVSWRHARLVIDGEGGVLKDLSSANGTFVGSLKNRIESAQISRDDTVILGTHRIVAKELFESAAIEHKTNAVELEIRQPIVLGRDPTCDQVLDHPMVSWRHARIRREGGRFVVEDLGSTNGTFINGGRVDGSSPARGGDVVGLGGYLITLTDGGRIITVDSHGRLSVEARGVSVDVPGKRLLDGVSLVIHPGEFVGLMGPSGAGKSTLMNALNGYVLPSEGAVLMGQRNLYEQYDLFRGQIGYVPQDDIMHGDLTVGEALFYSARMRLPRDFSTSDIRGRICTVLDQLGLQGTEDVLIGSAEKKGISGGQRKRVNLAMELLTDPSVLFLDEPTSGLSSEDALMVMKVLRGLADGGKTILLTIHQPSLEAYRQMDHLVVVAKDKGSTDPGQLAWFGPAYPDAIEFFNPEGVPGQKAGVDPSPDEVLRGLDRKPTKHWTQSYNRSRYRNELVTRRQCSVSIPSGSTRSKVLHKIDFLQLLTLLRRGMAIRLRDRANTALLMAQAPIIAILIVMVFGGDARQRIDNETWPAVGHATAMTCFLLALSSLWCGCSNSVREIVGEWAIYRRERMVNLKIPSYIASKLGVLLGLSAIQCFLLLGIVYWSNGLEGPFLEMYLVLLFVSAVGVGIGLAISALAKSSEFAVAMLPIVILPMIMMGGALQPIEKMSSVVRLGSHVIPARWAFESILLLEADNREEWPLAEQEKEANGNVTDSDAKTLAVKAESPRDFAEEFFPSERERTSPLVGTSVLIAMLAFVICIVGFVLRRRDIH